ncbi:Hypothetical predicted protein [Mytilus galloprovincialis]|uniref:WAP domain-containing protein n=1 Tax=Mytilus galloprovincialis TaxID=29158 RepID=A0A8B6EX20_MYTGA|nr:Hypothetical predicted protein [Mytilus galloprovincialis]
MGYQITNRVSGLLNKTDSECGHDSMCCPKECGKECTVKRKWGLCPTFTAKPAYFCMRTRVASNCGGNDSDCSGTKKCCPNICGSRQCKEPATKPRPECSSSQNNINKAAACHLHQCSHDKECTQGKICCDVTCGIGCTEPNIPTNILGGLMKLPFLAAPETLSHAFPLLSVGYITFHFGHFRKLQLFVNMAEDTDSAAFVESLKIITQLGKLLVI